MGNTSNKWIGLSDAAILSKIGAYIKDLRLNKNLSQAQLAEEAGLNRWTISKIENGESMTLSTLIQILRVLDSMHLLEGFEVVNTISPLEYAKLQKSQKRRAGRRVEDDDLNKEELGW